MGLGAGLDRTPPPGFDPRTAQPVASHYTDYAIPAAILYSTQSYRVFFFRATPNAPPKALPALHRTYAACQGGFSR